ncbi:branched-chain amino acid ABC transporter permease [Azorhizobium oxalatiphilum]|uniref:Branched-chain amino acid ABC transporter permease n=1 Tax=Azorhizobium oxalatiphilum TaxID=980631 RepID=A0A917F736_9HYPH|nr:branched-chain amino acid ABC transporter permease [Azorhizobium oxalatiphilum]GGF50277.1 branched-chain amino acid ABC transporter permease [Azorhizobium oxalatiphilum]
MFIELAQYVLNGLVLGALIALPALGLTLIFSVQGFVNFSVAAQMTVGAYAAWLAGAYVGWSPVLMLALAFVVPGILGIVTDRLALAPIRRQSSGHTALMLAVVSIALNLAIENALRFIFGSDLNSFDTPIERNVQLWGLSFGPQQMRNLATALVIALALAAFFSLTRWGKAMRAVADNADLARLKGIDPKSLSNLATFIGMGLAGVGGSLLAIDTSVDPSTGSRLLLVIFAASVLGGLTSLYGAVLGALLIGVIGEVALIALPPVYQSLTAFLAILIVLLVKPTGLFAGAAGVRK